jgi:hypothetical protein
MRIGDDVRILTRGGETVSGEVEDFDGDFLRLDGGKSFRLREGHLQRIDLRVDDSLANGALIGAGIGAGWTALACTQGCEAGLAVVGGLILAGGGAGLGALVDALVRGHKVIYSGPESGTRWSLMPMVDRDKKGLLFSVRF